MAANPDVLTPPLCVDLDGSVVRTDLLFEGLVRLVKRNALYLPLALLWLLRGPAALKAEVARRTPLDAATLPYNRELVDWLRRERARGREIWLCTAANEHLAQAVAGHLKLFDGVLASDARTHLAGRSKADRLVECFGYRAFHYCGAEWHDLPIWRCSDGAVVVDAHPSLRRQLAAHVPVLQTFAPGGSRLSAALRALRPHQWAKNALVLVPLLAAHRGMDLPALKAALVAALAFCLCASSVYLLNDMLDLEADRMHPRKCRRPFASGELPLAVGFLLVPVLLCAAAALAVTLPPQFGLMLGAYYALTLAYSFALKGMVILDAMALAGLYTLRIIGGAAAIAVQPSFWLLLLSVFLFLSLALVKRYAELDALRRRRQLQMVGRGYHVEDLPMLEGLGIAAGYSSVLVLALYINSPGVVALYHHPQAIWPLCALLLYWITRVWMKTHRGRMHDDPVVFALRDRVSLAIGALAAVTVCIAI